MLKKSGMLWLSSKIKLLNSHSILLKKLNVYLTLLKSSNSSHIIGNEYLKLIFETYNKLIILKSSQCKKSSNKKLTYSCKKYKSISIVKNTIINFTQHIKICALNLKITLTGSKHTQTLWDFTIKSSLINFCKN